MIQENFSKLDFILLTVFPGWPTIIIITKYVVHENGMLFDTPNSLFNIIFFLLLMLSCVTSFLWVSIDGGGGGQEHRQRHKLKQQQFV